MLFLSLGALCVVAGGGLLVAERRAEGPGAVRLPVVGEVSSATALTLALVLIFVGYHTAAYGGPAGLLTFHVPARLWWVVYGGGVLAVVGALWADELDRRG